MNKWIPEVMWNEMLTKSFLYDTQIAPIVEKYDTQLGVMWGAILILVVSFLVVLGLYVSKKGECRYYKQCLHANFGWFK